MCGQTTCKQAWRAASPEIRCPSATHMHKHRLMHGNGPASVPNKPTGQQMLRQGKKTGVNQQPFPSVVQHICSLSEVTRESTGWALKNIKPALKISQEDDGCLSTGIPFRASFIYTSRCRSSASLLLPKGIPACPDVQLFMWSRAMRAAGLKLHISRMNRRGRIFSQLHSQQIQSLFTKRQVFHVTGGGAGAEPSSRWVRGRTTPCRGHQSITGHTLFTHI